MIIQKIGNGISTFGTIFKTKLLYGNKIKFTEGIRIRKNCTFEVEDGGTIKIGKNVFFNNNCSIVSRSKVVIGDDTLIGENVKIYDHNHKFNRKNKVAKQGFSVGDITIGKNCWIASNVTILKGVHIGDNSVIGAGVVLNQNIPDSVVVTCKQNIKISPIKYK